MSLNLHLYPSAITHESRIFRVTKTLADAGFFSEIHIVGLGREGLAENEKLDGTRSIWRVASPRPWPIPKLKSLSFFLQWAGRIVRRYRGEDIRVVHCHSLNDLPIGVLLKKVLKTPRLVYDAHELETERNGLEGLPKRWAKLMERSLIRHVDDVLVVSEAIAEWYRAAYPGCRVTLVRNIPRNEHVESAGPSRPAEAQAPLLRERLGIRSGIVFLYQGALMRGRGIDLLLSTFAKADPDRHLVFMGYGVYEEKIREYAARHENIHFHPAVKPDELMKYTVGADVGVSIIENICLSYYYCLPNKLYEYIIAGLPVLVSDFPEMGRVVREFDNGWATPVREEGLLSVIQEITPESIAEKRRGSLAARVNLGWNGEAERLLDVYRGLAG